jgi:glycosyltransferase involved in cell wall biosynthesis
MARALEKHCGEVITLGPLRPAEAIAGKVIKRAFRALGGPTFLDTHSMFLSRRLGRMVRTRLRERPCDVIFAPACSTALAHLDTTIPIVYLSDATFHIMVDYYHEFTSLFPPIARSGDEIERRAIRRARRLIYPSTWAARSAVTDYGARAGEVHVIPFGANLEAPPERARAQTVPSRDRCRLLFIGGHWERKGGPLAYETFLELRRRGFDCTLTIIGCRPPATVEHADITIIPFLDKNIPAQRRQLDAIFLDSHFFLLPTRAECFSIALCEASAFGVPAISTETGGIPELVRNGLNGFLLPLDAKASQYATVISDAFSDQDGYAALRRSSRSEFEARLNWDAWGRAVKAVLEEVA